MSNCIEFHWEPQQILIYSFLSNHFNLFQIRNASRYTVPTKYMCRWSNVVGFIWIYYKSTSSIFNLKSTYLIKSNDQKIVQQPQITFYYYNFDFHIWLPSRKLTTAYVFATLGYKITPSSHKLKLMQHLIQWAR